MVLRHTNVRRSFEGHHMQRRMRQTNACVLDIHPIGMLQNGLLGTLTPADSSTSNAEGASTGAAATPRNGSKPAQAMYQQGVNPLQRGDPTAAFQQQAGAMSQLPIMHKLMSDPGMLERATQASPQLRALFSQSPQLAAMLQPDSLKNLLSAAQHPAQFQQHLAGKDPWCSAAPIPAGIPQRKFRSKCQHRVQAHGAGCCLKVAMQINLTFSRKSRGASLTTVRLRNDCV